jgi:hypothetical protein
MSVRQTFSATREMPAEYVSDNPGYCMVCSEEHDLDDDTDFIVIEGAGDDVIVCDSCHPCCQDCGDDVTHEDGRRHRVVNDDVAWIGDEPICFECLCVAVGGARLG